MSNGRIKLADDSLEPEDPSGFGVSEAGYHWVRATYRLGEDDLHYHFGPNKWTTGLVLTERPVYPWRRRRAYPLAIPDLFRIFASTKTDPDSIRAFADQYGELGPGVEVRSAKGGLMAVREAHERWQTEILTMRDAVRIWDAYDTGDEDVLAGLVVTWDEIDAKWQRRLKASLRMMVNGRWVKTDLDYEPWDWYFTQFDDAGRHEGYSQYSHSKVVEQSKDERELVRVELTRRQAARAFLASEASEYLRRFCHVELEERPRLIAEYKIRVAPQCLLGAMWWQLSRLVVGEATHRACKVCGKPMEISTGPHGGRTNREFCTDACKLKDHRRKVREVKQMKSEGKTVRQIAKHFDTDIAVIDNWLTKKK